MELLEKIIGYALEGDLSFLNVLNRVSQRFKNISSPFNTLLHISDYVGNAFGLLGAVNIVVSIRRLLRAAGSSSGLALRLRELFARNSRWINAWIQVIALPYSRFIVTDIFWR